MVEQLFKSDSMVSSWVQLAIKGVRQELNDLQKVQLGNAFMRGAEAMFPDLSHLDTPSRWPDARLKDDFVAALRQQASATSGVAIDDDRAFAHFLFALSATVTRLSSVASLGDDDGSIPQLRYIGYVLSKTARILQPNLLDKDQWTDVNHSFLNAYSCAALLSETQLTISKALDAREFRRFVPQAFQRAAY